MAKNRKVVILHVICQFGCTEFERVTRFIVFLKYVTLSKVFIKPCGHGNNVKSPF